MKYQILLLLIVSIVSVDVCQQIITYEECIATKDEQCQWMSIFNECLRSDNYLAGCESTLSESLCLKQLGDIFGNFAYCTFKEYCQVVNDLSIVKCSDPITKYGCLAITNRDALCKWERNSCQQVNQEDLSNLQQNFQDSLYSSSVCPHISGYLILHHTILWPLLEYEPNLITEADIQILEDTQSYEQEYKVYDQGDLQNNYVNSDGKYVWYQYKTTKTGTSLNLKITDRTRYGCIAMEILNDSEFLSVFSLQDNVIDGVNHVYCKYLNSHPTLVQLTAFVGNQCIFTNKEYLRKEQDSLNCHSLGQNGCQLQSILKCEILLDKEYICESVEEIIQNPTCVGMNGLATWQICQSGGICFLNMSVEQLIGFCDNSCGGNYSSCITLSQCKWIDKQIEGDNIHSCVPINGCSQLGVSQQYCVSMRLLCKWENGQCLDVDNMNILSCEEANTIFTCTSVILQNQYCIWINSKCINVQDSPLYSYSNNAYSEIQMNRLQCLNQKGYYFTYDEQNRKCVRQSQITMQCLDKNNVNYKQDILKDNMKCNNSVAVNISKHFCLNFYNSNNKWDQFYNQCLNLSEINNYYECEQLQQVNARVCSYANTNNELCLYNEEFKRCYKIHKIDHNYYCNDRGLNKQLCTSINTVGQTCKWSYGKCVNLSYADLQTYYCNAILSVNGNTCASFIGEIGCYYDSKFQNCAVAFVAATNCQQYQNPLACQATAVDCFYNWDTFRCEDATSSILNTITCNNAYLTQSACSKVSTPNAVCFWDNQCLSISDLTSMSCSTFPSMNEKACAYVNTLYINYLLEGNHCQYENQKCIQNQTIIPDCGSDLIINVHRCVAYTTGDCYFDYVDLQCKQLVGPSRFIKSILNEMTCNGTNIGLCAKITTPGQICWVISRNNNIKCSNYSSAKVDQCSIINTDYNTSGILNVDRNNSHNHHICTIATDSCYFNQITSKCEQPSDTTTLYPCTTPGASKIFCLSQTYGSCIYSNRQCTYQWNNVSISCDLRNIYACTMGTSRCQWNTISKLCVSSTTTCPQTYLQGVNQFNYLSCSIGYYDCLPIRNGCDSYGSSNLPCWISLNQGICESQNHYCQWINGKCQTPLDVSLKCEQIKDKAFCVSFLGRGCVYLNGFCFEPISPNECDIYEFTNSKFCSQFPDCLYNSSTNTCTNYQLNILKNSIQKPSQSYIDQISCYDLDSQYCIIQNFLSCNYSWSCSEPWSWGDPYCPYDGYELPSRMRCEQFPDCHYIFTKDAKSFCYEGLYRCESIYFSNCLMDIDLPCYLNDFYECATSTFTDIESIAPYEVNKAACDLIEGGIYINHKCKSHIRKQQINCSDNYELTDCAFIQLDCLINYLDDYFDSCTDGDSTFNNLPDTMTGTTNNWYGCVQLNDNFYIFDLNTYTCSIITDPYIILSCQFLNRNACIQQTHYANLNCAWNIDTCIELITDDYQCTLRNQVTCLKAQQYSCQWVNNSCQQSLFTECPTTELLLSPGVCQPYDNCYYEGQSCYLFTDYKLQFKHCDSLGLSQNDCIGQNIPCRWNNSHCENLNIYTASCTDLVSQSGCLSISIGCLYLGGSCLPVTFLDCSELDNNQEACLNQSQLPCSYDIQFKKCKNTTIINQMCLGNISKLSCALVQFDTCTFKQKKCQKQPFSQQSSCTLIINEYGCKDTQMTCIWDGQCRDFALPQKIPCQDLPQGLNNSACKTQALEDICALDVKSNKCSLIGNGYDYPSFSTYSQEGYIQPLLTQNCSYFTEYFNCILSKKYSCEWKTTCQPSSLITCVDQNFLACVNSNDDCTWRDNSCLSWSDYTITDYKYTTLVSKSVCPKLTLMSKYDLTKFSCIPFDQFNDSCDTVGLSKNSCLSLQGQQAACHFLVGPGCQFFTKTLENQCTDYLEVSVRVCQQIPLLSCKYEPTKQMCINSKTQDACLTPGLSQAGCEAVFGEACYWDMSTKQCLQFKINSNINQCDSETVANPLACAQITYLNTKCTYDSKNHYCTTQFNRFSRCDTPGTNPFACYAIESEACIFKNGQCQSFRGGDYMCFQLTNVNPRACRLLITDNCAYNSLTYSCESVMEHAPCNTSGLNLNACLANTQCSWNNDDKQCLCSQLRYQEQCDLTQDACIASSVCQYYLGECVRRTCHHLTLCEGVVNGQSCYLNQNNECQGAISCEDIVYLDSSLTCSNFNFKGLSCMQVNNRCTSLTDFNTLCPVSDCTSTSCMKDMGICRATRCSDRTIDNCTIKPGCGVIDKACTQVSSCSQIADMEMCHKVIVNGSPCSWEEYRILDSTMHCTNQQCQLFGPSYTVCNGNEINGQTCILDYDLQCRACEQITDMCTCNNSNNACTYQDQQCKSISCSNYVAKEECEFSNRCYWSRTDLVCRKMCPQNIRQDQCESVIYECHWNQYLRVCEQGVQEIPQLNVIVQMEEESGKILRAIVLAIIIMMSI